MKWHPTTQRSSASGPNGAGRDRAPRFFAMFGFFSSKVGCIGSIVVSIIGTLILMALMRGCSG
jgi:hypothetical protein